MNSPAEALSNLHNWENFKCETHPQLQIQVLGFNKTSNKFALVCSKCITEGDSFKTGGKDAPITIKDLLDSYSTILLSYKKNPLKNREVLHGKFLDFLFKDYMGTYERHLEAQYERVNKEIAEVIEMLARLRDKYKQYLYLELERVRSQTSEMKTEICILVESSTKSFSSMPEVYAQMDMISDHYELLDFLRDLHRKSKEQSDDARYVDGCIKLLASMDSFKEKALECQSKKVQVSTFGDMKETLQNFLQPESSAFMKSVEGLKASKPSEKEIEVESKKYMEFRPTRGSVESDDSDDDDERKTKGSIVASVHDWINRRITGYLVFQNTMNSESEAIRERDETGIHMNLSMGRKWKALSEDEKEEYKRLAVEYRKRLKQEFDEYDDSEKAKDILEILGAKVKKVKRE